MATQKAKAEDLREACLREALAIIETAGVEKLSMREVSRRLGVSHQAPYKHFRSRDHILAEIVSRAYAAFAKHLENRPQTGDPDADLGAMGRAYFRYALAHPLQYRLMFGTPLPDPEQHPTMMQQARHAFALLQDAIARLPLASQTPRAEARVDFDALAGRVERSIARQGALRQRVWDEPMLRAADLAKALGARSREFVRTLRDRSELLALPHKNSFLYPAFQVDVDRRCLYEEAAATNRVLRAKDKPWAAATWWVSQNGWLEARPCDLLGTDRAHEVLEAAKTIGEHLRDAKASPEAR